MDLPAGEVAAFALAVTASGVVAGLMAGIYGIGGGAVLVPVFYQVLGLLGVDDLVRMHLSVGSSLAIIVPTKRHLEIAFGLFALFVSARFGWSLV